MRDNDVIEEISEYINKEKSFSDNTIDIAVLILKDSMGCMIKSLNNEQCQKMLGPIEEGNHIENGIPVPGKSQPLGLLDASWNIGLLVRWLDYNDCFLAQEWGHPSDNLGGILATAYYQSLKGNKITVQNVLDTMIKAHEIQGVLSLTNSLNRNGYDHVFFVKVATAAVTSKLLGGDKEKVRGTVSNAFVDGTTLRIYRHSPNVTTRKSWAAGNATMKGVHLALLTNKLNEGYPNVLTENKWGFNTNFMNGEEINLSRPLEDYVINNILFKADFPAEFHAQTAAEAAMKLHIEYQNKLNSLRAIHVSTHESAIRIIAHKENLANPSDRDHSLEYITAVALLNGNLKTEYYYDSYHTSNPEIDELIKKMVVKENPQYTNDYLDSDKRSISNAVQLVFEDGTKSEEIEVEYPIGHKFRRGEAGPVIDRKFEDNLSSYFTEKKVETLKTLFNDKDRLMNMDICDFMSKWNIYR